jgi:hypothetical protein
MLTPEVVAQVKVVLNARRREDEAYRAVMAITADTGFEEVERLADGHRLAAALTAHEEQHLLTMVIQSTTPTIKALEMIK